MFNIIDSDSLKKRNKIVSIAMHQMLGHYADYHVHRTFTARQKNPQTLRFMGGQTQTASVRQ